MAEKDEEATQELNVVEQATVLAEERQAEIEARPPNQDYRVLVKIGGAGDEQVYLPGSRITLDDEHARPHLEAGNITPYEETTPPPAPITVQVVHDAPQPVRRKQRS